MNFSEIIKKVHSDKRLVPDLMKCEKGNNFRAVSESAILDVISPILEENGWFYTVQVKKSDLQIREAYGSKGKKLQFIATVEISLTFCQDAEYLSDSKYFDDAIVTEAVGMGIDDNDKAMGKAYTYAVKYALLKLFRLRYSDDPDFKASEPLYLEKPKAEVDPVKEEAKKNTAKARASSKKNEVLMTESQRDYILGLMDQKGINSSIMMGKFDGCDPKIDNDISMKVARAMIQYLSELPDDPFGN